MNETKITVAGIVQKIETLADSSIKISFITPELPDDEAAILLSLRKKQGWVLFSETLMNETDVPDDKPEFPNEKTPSQRLRNCLFVLWEQRGKQGDFLTFYRQQIERTIDQIKEKLE